ncbi:MAG: hypothetical protein KGD74_06265 [Candidatus Lokiarchaeota archaeon]|nr:hypothetical protein [Candidatus Lokiarchaeota archaeon]
MSNNSEDCELDYYLSIIDFYQNQNTDRETTEIWRNKSFIELMKVLKRTRNKKFVKNAIILILSLFDQTPPDSYTNRGIQVNSLTNGDKLFYVNILKSEFINDIPN